MTKFNAIRDFLWVFRAFLRGKLLYQKAYRPQGNFFRLPVPVTAKRITMLMKWWGHRPMTLNEAKALMEQMSKQDDDSGRAPFLNWTGSGWEKKNDWSDWDNSHRFIAVRH
jgi:hypothetical protein